MPRLVIDFMDGSRETFELPEPPNDPLTRRVRLDKFLEGRFLIIEEGSLENAVLFYPIENIKCIRAEGNPPGLELPPGARRGAKRVKSAP